MGKRSFSLFLLLSLVTAIGGCGKPNHYTFILPDNYVGWIQVIFNDPGAPPLPVRKDWGYEVDVPETGIARTYFIVVWYLKTRDEFYYRKINADGTKKLQHVPSDYVLPDMNHGGFTVGINGGRGPGYSWFIFIGPPELRAKEPLGDWSKVIAEHRAHEVEGHRTRIETGDTGPLPTPGRIPLPPNRQ
jgi:hypothetical protein